MSRRCRMSRNFGLMNFRFCSLLVFVVWSSSAEAVYTVNKNTTMTGDDCKMDYVIKGNGLHYNLTVPCKDALEILHIPHGIVLGNYRKNTVGLYSDTPGQMVEIKKGGCAKVVCTEEKSTSHPLDPHKCAMFKQKMQKAWKRHRTSGSRIDYVGGVQFMKKRVIQDNLCTEEFNIKSDQLDSTLSLSCKKSDALEVLHIPDGLLLGDYRKNDLCVYITTSLKVIVIQGSDKACRSEFTVDNDEAAGRLSDTDCKTAKEVIATVWDNNKSVFKIAKGAQYDKHGKCKNIKFKFHGKNIEFEIKLRCEIGDTCHILKLPNGFIMGDYRINGFTIFNSSKKVVRIKKKKGSFKCFEDTYGVDGVSSRTMMPFKCTAAKQFVDEQWDKMGKSAKPI